MYILNSTIEIQIGFLKINDPNYFLLIFTDNSKRLLKTKNKKLNIPIDTGGSYDQNQDKKTFTVDTICTDLP